MEQRVAVVGAGAVGLSTAVQIQQLHTSASVTLIADKFTTETTSHGAAGIFRPSTGKFPGVPLPQLKFVLLHCTFLRHIYGYMRRLCSAACFIFWISLSLSPKFRPVTLITKSDQIGVNWRYLLSNLDTFPAIMPLYQVDV